MTTPIESHSSISGRRAGRDRRSQGSATYTGIERRIVSDRRAGSRQREHPRYRPKHLTFVNLRSGSSRKVAKMEDISLGGLSYLYHSDLGEPKEEQDLSIFLSGGGFAVRSVPCRVASSAVRGMSQFTATFMRRYGVSFETLTSEQESMLDFYLTNHTIQSNLS